MARRLALLRAVNVGGRALPMAALRDLCAELGWADVETYIQSGNLLFVGGGAGDEAEATLERAIGARFGYEVPAMVRTAEQLRACLDANPFPDAAREAPSRLLLYVSKRPPADGAAEAVEARASTGERVACAGGALWVHFPEGVGRSKLTPALVDRAVGSPATGRNWRTAARLMEMLEA